MTSKIRRRTISAFIALSGLMSYLASPCSAQEVLTGSVSATSGSPSSSEPAPATPAATIFSGTNVIDFGNHDGGHFTLTGDLINNGTIYAISTNPAITTAIFSAPNIFNQTGATISSVLPVGGLPGYANAISGLSLIFNTTNNFVNAGTINSAGSLAINAGGSITNALPQGVIAPPPVMQAITNIDIASQIGNIVNAGTIASMTGNINITAAANNAVTMNNLGGIISALQGNINVRDALYTGTSQMNIAGGDWLSKNLNLMNGQGAITAQLRSATGIVNVYGLGANVGVWKGDLNLGVLKADGDPTYFSADGDVDLTVLSPINTDGEDLAIVAHGNITTAGDLVINTNKIMGNGPSGNVLMVAGASFIAPSSGDGLPAGPLVTIQFTGPGALDTGGSIAPGGALQINTSGTLNNSSAGNVTLVAYRGTNVDSGEIRTGDQFNSFITATNASGFSGGAVTMIAGGGGNAGSDAINFGNITGGGGKAAINIYAATPVITGGGGTITVVNGTVQSGSGVYTPGALTANNIALVDLNNDGAAGLDSSMVPFQLPTDGSNGGDFTIQTQGDLSINSIYTRGGKGGTDSISAANGAVGGNGGSIYLQGAMVQAFLVDVSGGDGGFGGSGVLATGGGKAGNAGSFTANGSAAVLALNITAKGGTGGDGGSGFFSPAAVNDNSGGAGGAVTLSAPDVGINEADLSGGRGGTGVIASKNFGGSAMGGGNGGTLTINASGMLQVGSNITARGGAGGIAGTGAIQDGSVLGTGGKGGSVQLAAGGDIDVNMIDVTGGDGGTVNLSNTGPGGVPSNAGDGGSIIINAGTGLFANDNFYADGGKGSRGEDSQLAFASNGSNGGKGGVITLSGAACCLGDLSANGGSGGDGGNGGTLGGRGGDGGAGGTISVTGSLGVTVGNVYAESGALGVGGSGTLNNGADGTGGNGGNITLASRVQIRWTYWESLAMSKLPVVEPETRAERST